MLRNTRSVMKLRSNLIASHVERNLHVTLFNYNHHQLFLFFLAAVMATYNYDESGQMAAYFVITFLALILIPLSLSTLPSRSAYHMLASSLCRSPIFRK